MSYQYDIFISYTRGGEAGEWVRNHFQPRLHGWLDQTMKETPRIFWDPDIAPGDQWPAALRDALAYSRVLVPVLTNPYFRSPWCVAELNTMIARARALDLGSPARSEGIIYPVRFHGEDFPPPIPEIQFMDMSDWAYPQPSFRDTKMYTEFVDAVKKFAKDLATRLPLAPAWESDWPVRLPDPAPLTEVALPRL